MEKKTEQEKRKKRVKWEKEQNNLKRMKMWQVDKIKENRKRGNNGRTTVSVDKLDSNVTNTNSVCRV